MIDLMDACPAPSLLPASPRVRPMTLDDLSAAADLSAEAFGLAPAALGARWRDRVAYPLISDPGGAFVAERDGALVGVGEAILRERLWCLSLLTVRPGMQSAGAGRALLEACLAYGPEADGHLIVCSNDPRAMRLYASAGFSLAPTLQTEGTVRRHRLRHPELPVAEGDASGIDALAPISRGLRGAAHTGELRRALDQGCRLLLVADRGYCLLQPDQGIWLLAARDEQAATALLWRGLALAERGERPLVRWITGDQQWAIRVLAAAGLGLSAYGALCRRGRVGPLAPFIPSGPFA